MQSWCRILPLNGSRRIRAKTKLHKKPREACKSSWNPRGILKSFTLTIPWNSAKLVKISWNHCTSTPHRSETNGIAERAVRRVKDGTSAVLLQSGLNENWWADSMEWYTYLRNVTDLLSDGKTPYEIRFGQPFNGPIIPFGSLVEYHVITAKDQSRIHQFGKKVLLGLVLGYALYAEGLWKGDIMVADLEESEKVILIFLENQRGLFHHLTTRFRMPVKQLMTFGSCQETSYTAITLNLESSFTRREKNHSLFH